MRAVVFAAQGKLLLQDRDELVPGPKEVLIETAAVGVCGTDTHVFAGEFEGTVYPLVPGHEATGTVVAVGPGVAGGRNPLAVGDRVSPRWRPGSPTATPPTRRPWRTVSATPRP